MMDNVISLKGKVSRMSGEGCQGRDLLMQPAPVRSYKPGRCLLHVSAGCGGTPTSFFLAAGCVLRQCTATARTLRLAPLLGAVIELPGNVKATSRSG